MKAVYALASGDLGRNQNGDPITVTTITNGAQIERSFCNNCCEKWCS